MKNEEIINGNKIIAEFMENELRQQSYSYEFGRGVYKTGDTIKRLDSYFWQDKLVFHGSWDWLIPVLQKIKIEVCEAEFNYRFKELINTFDIEKVHNEVVIYLTEKSQI